jgi:type I restriction enzyme M protein
MLAENGRMAIVLPRGVLKNYNDEYIRRHLLTRARVCAVVSLTGQMFKPFTNTKTCIVFLQKRPNPLTDLRHALKDRPTVYSVLERPGKNRSGAIVVDDNGEVVSDCNEVVEFIQSKTIFEGCS